MRFRFLITALICICTMLCFTTASQQILAKEYNWLKQSPQLVGKARFRVFFFNIYDAQLFSPDGLYDGTPPYALKLSYLRDVARSTIIESSLDEMRRQGVRDDKKLKKWAYWMDQHFPDIQDGDDAMMVALTDGGMMLLHNEIELGRIDDPGFTSAFLGIWLSDDTLKPHLSKTLRGLRAN